jgi:uncharacterized protein YbjT (DUF2867 family)
VNVLVTGGTGTLGRHVVMFLRQSGHRARILSRQPRGHVDALEGDLRTGAGLQKAVVGMDAIVHAASAAREPLSLRATDVRGTRRLLELARDATIGHVVFTSIVGIDRVPSFPYYRAKLAAEAEVREDLVPWSILRATQFHNLMEIWLRGFSRLPGVTAIPLRWQFQPVDPKEVARRVVDAVLGKPAGVLPDFGGPEVRDFKGIAEAWLIARKEQRRLINLPLPFKFSRQFAEGMVTCPDHKDGVVSFDQYLAETYPLS